MNIDKGVAARGTLAVQRRHDGRAPPRRSGARPRDSQLVVTSGIAAFSESRDGQRAACGAAALLP